MKHLKYGLIFTLLLSSQAVLAEKVHTWHTVRVGNGAWHAHLQMINENGVFVARDGSTLNDFSVSQNAPKEYGFAFAKDADFDVAYTLTLTENDKNAFFSSKACVFVVTAAGPANPDVRVSEFNGAKCSWVVVPGVGEDFLGE